MVGCPYCGRLETRHQEPLQGNKLIRHIMFMHPERLMEYLRETRGEPTVDDLGRPMVDWGKPQETPREALHAGTEGVPKANPGVPKEAPREPVAVPARTTHVPPPEELIPKALARMREKGPFRSKPEFRRAAFYNRPQAEIDAARARTRRKRKK